MFGAQVGQEKALDSLDLELWMLVNYGINNSIVDN